MVGAGMPVVVSGEMGVFVIRTKDAYQNQVLHHELTKDIQCVTKSFQPTPSAGKVEISAGIRQGKVEFDVCPIQSQPGDYQVSLTTTVLLLPNNHDYCVFFIVHYPFVLVFVVLKDFYTDYNSTSMVVTGLPPLSSLPMQWSRYLVTTQ